MSTLQTPTDVAAPESWPSIDLILNGTLVAAGVWLAASLAIRWRRRAWNLTPVDAASKNKKAQPEFLSVDNKAREEARERGDAFEARLVEREKRDGQADLARAEAPLSFGRRLAGFAALGMSVFSLLTMIFGSIWQVSWMGRLLDEYSADGRLMAVVKSHPIAVAVAALVVLYHLFTFINDRKWQAQA